MSGGTNKVSFPGMFSGIYCCLRRNELTQMHFPRGHFFYQARCFIGAQIFQYCYPSTKFDLNNQKAQK